MQWSAYRCPCLSPKQTSESRLYDSHMYRLFKESTYEN